MEKLNLKKLSFDCKCPECNTWWTCGEADLKSKVVIVRVSRNPGRMGSLTHYSNRTRYYVSCANCQAEIVVNDVHPALKEWIDEEAQQK